jgi:hypothetical protein
MSEQMYRRDAVTGQSHAEEIRRRMSGPSLGPLRRALVAAGADTNLGSRPGRGLTYIHRMPNLGGL